MEPFNSPVNRTLLVATFVALSSPAFGGEKMLCHLEPGDSGGWHYRTKVGGGGKPLQCWYQGPEMKPRRELYWAEIPTVPPLVNQIDIMEPEGAEPPNEFDLRWKGER